MAWTYGGVRIYVQKSNKGSSQIMPRLQPLSGGSVLQSFGYDSAVRTISAIIVGDTNENTLYGFSKDDATSHALVSPEGSLGSWILKEYSADRDESTCQTIDITQAEDAPVYNIELTLWRED